MHWGPYDSGNHGENTTAQIDWVPVLQQYRVDAILSGHDYDYERGFSSTTNLRYIVTGGGGAPLYTDEQPKAISTGLRFGIALREGRRRRSPRNGHRAQAGRDGDRFVLLDNLGVGWGYRCVGGWLGERSDASVSDASSDGPTADGPAGRSERRCDARAAMMMAAALILAQHGIDDASIAGTSDANVDSGKLRSKPAPERGGAGGNTGGGNVNAVGPERPGPYLVRAARLQDPILGQPCRTPRALRLLPRTPEAAAAILLTRYTPGAFAWAPAAIVFGLARRRRRSAG